MAGLEPATIRLTVGRSAIGATYHQSERKGSNLRHAGYKPVALPLSYVPLADGNSYMVEYWCSHIATSVTVLFVKKQYSIIFEGVYYNLLLLYTFLK